MEKHIRYRPALWVKMPRGKGNLDADMDDPLCTTCTVPWNEDSIPHAFTSYKEKKSPQQVITPCSSWLFSFPFSEYSLVLPARTFCFKWASSLTDSLLPDELLSSLWKCYVSQEPHSKHLHRLHICFGLLCVGIYLAFYVSAFRGQGWLGHCSQAQILALAAQS